MYTIASLKAEHKTLAAAKAALNTKACHPALMAVASNLIVITKETHDDYHAWLFRNSADIDRSSLIEYAQNKGYSTDYSHDLNWPSKKRSIQLGSIVLPIYFIPW